MAKAVLLTGMSRVQQMALGLFAVLVAAAPAAAQEPGVTIDPSSPSAKQYVLPLDSARRQADPAPKPSASGRGGSTSSAALFGAGVGRSRGSGGSGASGPSNSRSASAGGRGSSAGKHSTSRRRGGGATPLPAVVREAVAQPGAPGGGVGTEALVVGGAILVLLLGAGIGVAARRRAD